MTLPSGLDWDLEFLWEAVDTILGRFTRIVAVHVRIPQGRPANRVGSLPARSEGGTVAWDSSPMKILLDTNVWRYIVDAGALLRLQQAAGKSRHKVVVAPAVVYEALRTGDRAVRTALVRALALPDWTRLMPEAYSEAMEVRDEVFRVRPQWQRAPADTTQQRRLQFDWKRSRNGF